MIILKLGGSLLTDKKKKFSIRTGLLERVAREISLGAREQIIIVHGGGSFGHPVASQYKIHLGFMDDSQLKGVAETRKSMQKLNLMVMEALIAGNLNVVAVQPSANFIMENNRIATGNTEILKGFLHLKMIPVLFGDVVLDRNKGFGILSGDQIISWLSQEFHSHKIILATDVDGVFDGDPKKDKDSRIISEISLENYKSVLENLGGQKGDVTGGIKGKVIELIELANKGHSSIIINAMVEDRLKKVLLGEAVIGTKIQRGNYN